MTTYTQYSQHANASITVTTNAELKAALANLDSSGGGTILLDANGGPAFLAAVEKELDSGANKPLRVDLGKLEYIDSAGAAVLIEGSYRARRRSANYALRNLTDDAKKIFALTGGGAFVSPAVGVRTLPSLFSSAISNA